jgi:di/tricarboxylate transporter
MYSTIFLGLSLAAWVTIAVVLALFLSLIFTKIPEDVAFMGAIAMLVFRCCTPGQAFKAIDWSILMVFAGSVVIGKAIETPGIAQTLAEGVMQVCNGKPLLVYGPGGYRFTDFLKAGIPMTIVILLANLLIVNLIYPL